MGLDGNGKEVMRMKRRMLILTHQVAAPTRPAYTFRQKYTKTDTGLLRSFIKAAFHDIDNDTDTDNLAMILERMLVSVSCRGMRP